MGLYFCVLGLLGLPLMEICLGHDPGKWWSLRPWAWGTAALLAFVQAALLGVPAELVRGRTVSRRLLLIPVVTTGFLTCLLVITGLGSLILAVFGDNFDVRPAPLLMALLPLPLLWGAWAGVFSAYSRTADPERLVARLMKGLLREASSSSPWPCPVMSSFASAMTAAQWGAPSWGW